LDELGEGCQLGGRLGEVGGGVALQRRGDDSVGQVGEGRVCGVQVVGAVVLEVEAAQFRVVLGLGLVGEVAAGRVGRGGEREDPQVPLQRDPAVGETEVVQPEEVLLDLGGQERAVAGGKRIGVVALG
jgi:hypothetical protein